MSERTKADNFLLTIRQRTPSEIMDEMYRLRETVDVDGLKRLLAAVDAEIERKAKAGDGDNNDELLEEKDLVENFIATLERCEAKKYQRALLKAESTTLGLEEPLKHNHDLMALQERVLELFDWYNQRRFRTYMAPYFPMIQSSGTGKTRLLMALRDAANKNDPNANYDCKTILCMPEKANAVYNQGKYFDDTLRLPLFNQDIKNTLYDLLRSSTKEKLVLLFDNAHNLLDDDNNNGNAFRCILWWLRQTDRDTQVVAVFAGTSVQLANAYSNINHYPPPGGFSRAPTIEYVNWKERKGGPNKLYDPFFRIATMGCFQTDAPTSDDDDDDMSDFQRSAYFGRPLFAYLQKINALVLKDDAKRVGNNYGIEITNSMLYEILKRMLMVSHTTSWRDSTIAIYSILASRVQIMGITTTSLELSSALVSQAYAHLADFKPDESGDVKRAFTRISFMSDPVCAALAMGLMQEGWTLKKNNDDDNDIHTGETKPFWSQHAVELLESSLCYSEKGDYGEIMAALYMLFCGDVLRHESDKSMRTFSVALTDWYSLLRNNKNITEGKPKAASASKLFRMEVNFIQVCRNYFRAHSWRTQKALELMYKSATATYLHRDCEEIDLVASIRVMRKGKSFYHPLLVKVQYCMQLSEGEIEEAMVEMKTFLNDIRHENTKTGLPNKNKADLFSECPPALCLIMLLGVETQQKEPRIFKNQLISDDLGVFPEDDTFRVVAMPTDDAFGISKAVGFMAAGQEMSHVFASHGFVYVEKRANGLVDDDETSAQVLRKRSHPDKVMEFVQNMFNGFKN